MDMKATLEDMLGTLELSKDTAVNQLISTYEGLKRTLEEQAAFRRDMSDNDVARLMDRAAAVVSLRVNLNFTTVNLALNLDGRQWSSTVPLSEPLEEGRYRFLIIAQKLKDGA